MRSKEALTRRCDRRRAAAYLRQPPPTPSRRENQLASPIPRTKKGAEKDVSGAHLSRSDDENQSPLAATVSSLTVATVLASTSATSDDTATDSADGYPCQVMPIRGSEPATATNHGTQAMDTCKCPRTLSEVARGGNGRGKPDRQRLAPLGKGRKVADNLRARPCPRVRRAVLCRKSLPNHPLETDQDADSERIASACPRAPPGRRTLPLVTLR